MILKMGSRIIDYILSRQQNVKDIEKSLKNVSILYSPCEFQTDINFGEHLMRL